MTDVYQSRAERLVALMRERGLDAVIVYASSLLTGAVSNTSGNVLYLTNWSHPWRACMLVLTRAGDATLFGATMIFQRQWAASRNIWVKDRPGVSNAAGVRHVLGKAGIATGRIGLIGNSEMPVGLHEGITSDAGGLTFEDADDLLTQIKHQKDPHEIELGRRAVANGELMLEAVVRSVRAGKKVYEVMADANHAAMAAGSDWSYAWLGPTPGYEDLAMVPWQGDRSIENGDLVQAVIYNTFEGRHCQLIRTGVKGKASTEQKRWLDTAIDALDAGINHLAVGRPMIECAEAMEGYISAHTPMPDGKPTIQGRCGHLQGVQYADAGSEPFLAYLLLDKSAASKILVTDGMRFVLHPNFIAPGVGWISVGVNALVIEAGVEVIDKFPRRIFEA